jgi:hypothetical protein
MNKLDQKFVSIIRDNHMRAYYTAHGLIESVSTNVLYNACNELLSRAKYLFIVETPEKADYANQFAGQIIGVLNNRNVNTDILLEKMKNNMTMF